jgi:osmoprotectant transport system permease protein
VRGAAWLLAVAPALLWLTIGLVGLSAGIGWLLGAPSPFAAQGALGLGSNLAALGVRGIGVAPALLALTLYSLLPIVRNTLTGLQSTPLAAVSAGRGMGMSDRQLLLRVEVPLALPLIIEGVRGAAVLVIGITTVAFLIGAGGLGVFIQRGIDQVVPDLVLLGALPVIALALLADAGLRAVGLLLVAPPLRRGGLSA